MPALEHPSPADLQAFAIGALSEEQARAVEGHLAECPSCLSVAAVAPDDTLVTLLRSAETSQAGPVTPGPAFAETIGLSQAGPPAESIPGPPELVHHTRYRLIRPLGRGGMGHVWLAEHTLMGRPVALKLIRPEFLDKPDAVERFRREVRAAAKLKHANIVAAHDADQAGGLHFLVMEYIDGETLAERIAAGPVPVEDACRWAIDAARGLEHARENGLIHRDVKPHNLILERATGRVKVLDFGLAGVATGESTGLTGGNVVIGTPDYIAPEQAEDARTADTRSDVYSLGCTLYHLLAGRPPFPGDAVLKKLDAHRLRDPEPLTAIRQDLTPALADLVARMLAKDPADRPQTPGEVAVALEQILAGRGGEPPGPARRPWGEGSGWRRARKAVLWLAALAAVIFLVGLACILYLKATDRGTLVIETEYSSVKVFVKKDRRIVEVIDTGATKSATLPVGQYELEYQGPADYHLSSTDVVIRRGERVIVLVERKPHPNFYRPPADPPPGTVVLHGKPDAPWTDLVPFVDVTADQEHGQLVRETHDGRPALRVKDTGGFARVRLPFRPESGDYEVRARVTRVEGNDSFNLMLPLPASGGRTQVGLYLDGFPQRGGYSGLEWKNGPAMPMEKTKLGRLVTGRPYDVLARVSAAGNRVRIHLEANQTPVFDWEGPLADAQNGMNFFTNDRRYVGFGACAGAYRVERFEVRMVSGAGQITRTDQAPPAKAPEAQRELTGSPDAPWVNLFDGLSAAAGVVDGSWGWSGGIQVVSLLAGQADGKAGRFALPVWPKGDYELRLRFARTDGDGGLVVLLPVPGAGTQTAAFVDGYRAFPAAGISKVGEPLRASLESRLKNHTMHTLVVRVTEGAGQTTIQAEMNGTRVVRWQGPPAGAPPAAGWSLADPGRLGLGVPGNCQFVLPTVEFRPLSGTAVWKPQKAADFKP